MARTVNILGVSDSHNASVCHLRDGEIVFALQEERLSRVKNHWGMPRRAIQACVDHAGLRLSDFDEIIFAGREYSGSYVSNERFQQGTRKFLAREPGGLWRIAFMALRLWHRPWVLRLRLDATHWRRLRDFRAVFLEVDPARLTWVEHHLAHGAAALYGSGFAPEPEGLLVFTADAVGDFVSGTVHLVGGAGDWKCLCRVSILDSRVSLANLYGFVTVALGFKILEHEYKLMGMAPYANVERSRRIMERFQQLMPLVDGKWRYAGRHVGRKIRDILSMERMDEICCGLQMFFEDAITRWIRHWIDRTGVHRVCLSGGAFMNVKANMQILALPEVERLFVFPSCGDETNALGAAYHAWHRRSGDSPRPMESLYLGRSFSREQMEAALHDAGGEFQIRPTSDVSSETARMLSEGEVVATFWGREEFGARALGNRSILADPRNPRVVARINDMIKSRDFWMPFASTILDTRKDDYIRDNGKAESPFMILAYPGGPRVEDIYAGSHPRDRTVRPQILTRAANPLYYDTITAFERLTGIGAVLNTSFNLHGHPLVGTPAEALDVLRRSGLRHLAFEHCIVSKS